MNLPLAPTQKIKHSKNGWKRAGVLIGLHVLIAVHIWHYHATGSSVSPVEPSESVQTIETGLINAGFLFFAAAILATLVFGRWVCGWGCHLVALQDLCSAMLKRVGIRPKPIRSRLLMWIPLIAALYMFVWPAVALRLDRRTMPSWAWHLTTNDFWKTFPNWQIATFTFLMCGFLIVYVLGNKGFCTYGCPYGGFFSLADRFAPGRIRVNDNCNQCGHCTAVCTSNVRVHEEVKLFRAVQDPGCMKCMDCVSVCPNGALAFQFGSPFPKNKGATVKRKTVYDFTLGEEAVLGVLFVAQFWVWRGLYNAIPFLLSLGLSAIGAFWLLGGIRLFTKPNLRVNSWQLKSKGKISGTGWGYAAFIVALLAFYGHSALVQWNSKEGSRLLEIAQEQFNKSQVDSATVAAAESHLEKAVSLAIFPVADWESKLGAIKSFMGKSDEAIAHLNRAIELDDSMINTRAMLVNTLIQSNRNEDALPHLEWLDSQNADLDSVRMAYAEALVKTGEPEKAIHQYELVLEKAPKETKALLNLGLLYAQTGDLGKGESTLRKLLTIDPNLAPAHLNLGLILASQNMPKEGEAELKTALRLDPKLFSAWTALIQIQFEQGKFDEALQSCRSAILLDIPFGQIRTLYRGVANENWREERAWLKKMRESRPDLKELIDQLMRLT